MPSTDAPNWWADVQQEREDLAAPGRRPADDWLGEDIDFVPRRRMTRAAAAPLDDRLAVSGEHATDGAGHPLHGVFVPADTATSRTLELVSDDDRAGLRAPRAALASRTVELVSEDHDPNARRARAVARVIERDDARSRTIELLTGDDAPPAAGAHASAQGRHADVAHELAHLSAADDPFASPPPPAGTRRTVQIKGRPTEAGRLASVAQRSMAQRHRGRTTSDRVGHRPDRIALWAVALGAILILLAAMTSSSQAAVRHAAKPAATTAKVAHAKVHAPRGTATVRLHLR